MGIYFNGRYYIKPSVLTYVDDTGLNPVNLTASNVIGMMGLAKDGVPNQAYLITGTKDALDIFKDGPLVDGISAAFAQGAQYVWATRLGGTYSGGVFNTNTLPKQSKLTYVNNSVDAFTVKSASYGEHANGIKIAANSEDGFGNGFKVSIVSQGNSILSSKITAEALNIKNSVVSTSLHAKVEEVTRGWAIEFTPGNPAKAIGDLVMARPTPQDPYSVWMCVTAGDSTGVPAWTNTLYDVQLESGNNPVVKWMNIGELTSDYILSIYRQQASPSNNEYCRAIILNQYSNETDLKDAVDSVLSNAKLNTGVAAPITGTTITVKYNPLNPLALDAGSISVASTDATGKNLTYELKAFYDWLNNNNQPYVIAEEVDSSDVDTAFFSSPIAKDRADFFTVGILDNSDYKELTGGTYGNAASVDATSYQGVLDLVYEDLDLDIIVPIVDDYVVWSGQFTNADAIFQNVYNHCKTMSENNSEERIGIVGYNTDTYSTLISNAANFNSAYVVVAGPRLTYYDIKGNLRTFNGTYTAAAIAGMIANYSVGEPITNKFLSGISGLSTYYTNSEILQLIDNGVCTIERLRGAGYRVVQGVTSWIADDNFNRKEISVRLVTNYVAKNCREALKTFIGRKNSPYIATMIKSALVTTLKQLEAETVIVGNETFPAYRNLTVVIDGDIVRVDFECSPVLPINFIAVTVHMTIFKATI